MIPDFNRRGELPPGIHAATLNEVGDKLAFNPLRLALFEGLRRGLKNLRAAGVRYVYLDGSFVSAKAAPADVDGCLEAGDYVQVGLLDPVWLDFANSRATMRQKYGTDFFPHFWIEAGTGKPFVDFFQTNRNGIRSENMGLMILQFEKRVVTGTTTEINNKHLS